MKTMTKHEQSSAAGTMPVMSDQLSLFSQSSPTRQPSNDPAQSVAPIPINKDAGVSSLLDLLPEDALFALNRHYSIRANHVSRILCLAYERRTLSQPITRDDVAQELAMSWARMQGAMNVMRRAELLRPKNAPTPFGELVVTRSRYLDNPGLLWFLHYLLASDARLVLWSHLFDALLHDGARFTVADVGSAFSVLRGKWSDSTLEKKLRNEVGGIIRTYAEEMFAVLGLISRSDVGGYEVNSHTAVIPSLAWLGAILVYRDRYYPGAPSLEIPLIVDAHFSPGRVLRQSDAAVRRALDELHRAELLTVETRSGLDQVRFRREVTWLGAMMRHLNGKEAA